VTVIVLVVVEPAARVAPLEAPDPERKSGGVGMVGSSNTEPFTFVTMEGILYRRRWKKRLETTSLLICAMRGLGTGSATRS
jgi:hypothetical protein